MLALLILIPFISVIALNLPFRILMRRLAFWLAALLSILQVILVITRPLRFWSVPAGALSSLFSFNLFVDNFSLVLLLCIGIVFFVSLVVGRYMIGDSRQRFDFINLLLLALIGMNGTVMVTDIFSLYVFIEVTAVTSFILIAMQKDKLALEGAFKYIILSAVASVMMLTAIGLFVLAVGNTSFAAIAGLSNGSFPPFAKLAVGLFLCGLFIKSGIVPFHGWLPDAYTAAPAAVSVFLAGIVTKVSGVYALIRLVGVVFVPMPSIQYILMFVGALSIVMGALSALGQVNFKRILAYSSISQVGYIVLALGCGTPLALFGAVFHLFNHAIFKSLLFVNAAALEKKFGSVDINKLQGKGATMPYTAVSSVIASLSTAGLPPLSGFWSKLIIVIALWKSSRFGFASVALLASIITLAYFLLVQRKIFFSKPEADEDNSGDAGRGLVFPEMLLSGIILLIGIGFPLIVKMLSINNILW